MRPGRTGARRALIGEITRSHSRHERDDRPLLPGGTGLRPPDGSSGLDARPFEVAGHSQRAEVGKTAVIDRSAGSKVTDIPAPSAGLPRGDADLAAAAIALEQDGMTVGRQARSAFLYGGPLVGAKSIDQRRGADPAHSRQGR